MISTTRIITHATDCYTCTLNLKFLIFTDQPEFPISTIIASQRDTATAAANLLCRFPKTFLLIDSKLISHTVRPVQQKPSRNHTSFSCFLLLLLFFSWQAVPDGVLGLPHSHIPDWFGEALQESLVPRGLLQVRFLRHTHEHGRPAPRDDWWPHLL